jgi:small subunit ribosomal protein S16
VPNLRSLCAPHIFQEEQLLRIRLTRTGAHKSPSYRIVVADTRWPRDGKAVEILGHYNALTNPATYHIKQDRAIVWLDKGAQPSEAVSRILTWSGVQHKLVHLPDHAKPAKDR